LTIVSETGTDPSGHPANPPRPTMDGHVCECVVREVHRRLAYRAGDPYYRVLQVCNACGTVQGSTHVARPDMDSVWADPAG